MVARKATHWVRSDIMKRATHIVVRALLSASVLSSLATVGWSQQPAITWLGTLGGSLSRAYSVSALKGLGYRHLIGYIQGRVSWDEAVRLWKRDTRRFAKRQMTWFRTEPGVHWVDASQGMEQTARLVELLLMEQGGITDAEID